MPPTPGTSAAWPRFDLDALAALPDTGFAVRDAPGRARRLLAERAELQAVLRHRPPTVDRRLQQTEFALAKPNEFGYLVQYAEVTANTKRGARGLLLPPKLGGGSTHENTLLAETAAELTSLGITVKEASFDAGFTRAAEPMVRDLDDRIESTQSWFQPVVT